VSLVFVYGSRRKVKTNVRRSKKRRRRRKKKKKKSRELILQKKFLSPLFYSSVFSLLCAHFLQLLPLLFTCVFPCLIYCPWSVSCWKIQPTKFGIRALFKEVFWAEI
jgi:hypothetical protein